MVIDQNHLLMVQHGKISTGRAKELIEAELQKELEERIGLLRQYLNELTDKRLITDDDIKKWLIE